jgi:hypothetical protein
MWLEVLDVTLKKKKSVRMRMCSYMFGIMNPLLYPIYLLKWHTRFFSQRYGCVLRHNRLFVKALHRENPGGAVADRTAQKEKNMIKLLHEKWAGCFKGHRRKNEVHTCISTEKGSHIAKHMNKSDREERLKIIIFKCHVHAWISFFLPHKIYVRYIFFLV